MKFLIGVLPISLSLIFPAAAQTLKDEVMRANPSLSQCAQREEIKAHCAADQSEPRAICKHPPAEPGR
jgi:hypothetical protein